MKRKLKLTKAPAGKQRWSLSGLTPFKIALIYAGAGCLWIAFSDSLLNALVREPDVLMNVELLKGWVYVFVTAFVLYLLVRRFEKTNLESEGRYRAVLEQASDGIFIMDGKGAYVAVNEKSCQMLGYREDELLRLNLRDLVPSEDLDVSPLRFGEMMAGKSILVERRLRRKDGTLVPVEISGRMLKDGLFLGLVRDVSEHRRKDEALALRTRQLEVLSRTNRQINSVLEIPVVMRTLVNAARDLTGAESGTAGLLADGRMVFREYNHKGELKEIDYSFNPGYGVPGMAIRSLKPYLSNDAEHDAHVDPEMRRAFHFKNLINVPVLDRAGALLGCFEIHNKKDGQPFDEHDLEMLEGLAAGAAVAIENAKLLDEHRRAEAAVRDSEKKFRNLAETAAAAIFIYQETGFRYVNSQSQRLTGYTQEELLRMNFWDVVHPAHREMVRVRGTARLQGGYIPTRYEFKLVTKGGEVRWVDFTSATIEFEGGPAALGTAYDITERRNLEEQLLQSQKMEAVGLLAGGVAHDFNNILTAIIGYGNLVKAKVTADDLRAHVDQILQAADRAARLTRGLLAFSRKQVLDPKPVDINDIIVNVGKLLARLIGEDIDLKLVLSSARMIVLADSGQMEQVLMNLATNARDAMPHGGSLTIATKRMKIDAAFIKQHGYGSPGEYAVVTVADTGAGMERKILDRIFEPFFTTKETGKGTGLGLSIVYGIVKQHDGFITAASEPGKGSSFSVSLRLLNPREGGDQAQLPEEAARAVRKQCSWQRTTRQ